MVKAEIEYRRSVCGGLTELLDVETVELNSKTQVLKLARQHKKNFAKLCYYRTTGDIVNYKITYLQNN